jgi:hypothetical protein
MENFPWLILSAIIPLRPAYALPRNNVEFWEGRISPRRNSSQSFSILITFTKGAIWSGQNKQGFLVESEHNATAKRLQWSAAELQSDFSRLLCDSIFILLQIQ